MKICGIMRESGVDGMTKRQKKWLYLASLAVFLLFSGLVGWHIGVPMVRFVKEPELFRAWVDRSGIWGKLLFVGMVFLQVIVALIPGEPLELAAGYAFGAVEGAVLSMAGILLGSMVIFLLVRRFGPGLVEVFFPEKKLRKLSFLKNPQKTKVLAFILMTIPGTPKDMLSYFAGLTPLTLGQWLKIVLIARIPSLVTSTISGGAAGEENYLLAAVTMAFTVVMSGAGILYYRKICREQNK